MERFDEILNDVEVWLDVEVNNDRRCVRCEKFVCECAKGNGQSPRPGCGASLFLELFGMTVDDCVCVTVVLNGKINLYSFCKHKK